MAQIDPSAVDRLADALGRLTAGSAVLDRLGAALASLTLPRQPVAPPGSPPPSTAAPAATALQPLNVQMAELVGVTKGILLAVAGGAGKGEGGGGPPAQATGGGVGVAALKALQAAVQGLGQAAQLTAAGIGTLNRFVGEVQGQIAGVVGAFSPGAVKQFEMAVHDLHGSLGEALLPVLKNFEGMVRAIGAGIASLSGPGKAVVAGLAAASVGLATLTAAAAAFSVVVNTALGGVPALLGVLAGTAAAGLAGFTFAIKDTAAVQATTAKVMAAVTKGFDALGAALVPVAKALDPLVDVMADHFAAALGQVADILVQLTPAIEVWAQWMTLVARGVSAVTLALMELSKAVMEVLGLESKPSGYTPDADKGKGVRQASFGTVDEYLKKAQLAAYTTPNEAKKPEDETAKNTLDMKAVLDEINKKFDTLLQGAAANVGGAVQGAVGAATAATPFGPMSEGLAQQMLDHMRLR